MVFMTLSENSRDLVTVFFTDTFCLLALGDVINAGQNTFFIVDRDYFPRLFPVGRPASPAGNQ